MASNYGSSSNSESWSSALQVTPVPGFTFAGSYDDSSANYQGSNGWYWSSTASSNNYAYDLRFSSVVVSPANSNYKHYGYSVRCISRQ